MKLRDHPAMIRKSGYYSWPPLWTTPHRDRDERPVGEVGVLDDVAMSNLIDNKVFLFMELRTYRYMGVMAFDDPEVSRAVFGLFKSQVGHSIEEIGNMEVSLGLKENQA